jgi:hypothetical protein
MTRGFVRDLMEEYQPIGVGKGKKAPRKKPNRYKDQSEEGRKARLKQLREGSRSLAEMGRDLREAQEQQRQKDKPKFQQQPEQTTIGPVMTTLCNSKPLNRYSKIAFGCVAG